MKTMNIEGTVDIIGFAEQKPGGRLYSQISFLTPAGDEILARNVTVTDAMSDTLMPGITGKFTLVKRLFSTTLETMEPAVLAG